MTRYVIAILILIAAIAGILLWIGNDVFLQISSTATTGLFAFSPVEVSWQFAALMAAAGIVLLIGFWSLCLWLWNLPQRVRSGVGLRRRNKALDAMEEALIAGAEGNVPRARKKAEKARALIQSPELGRIVSALSAEAAGDCDEAVTQYEAMLDHEKTRATGRRGLAQNMLAKGDIPGAIAQSREAFEENRDARWAFETLFKAEIANHQWLEAEKTLEAGAARKHVTKNVARRRRAVLFTAEADLLHDKEDYMPALDLASAAASAAPEFAPAIALAAKLHKINKDPKSATRLIEKSWAKAPHPALALAYMDALSGEDTKTCDKRLASLAKSNPNHRETKILQAEMCLRRKDAVQAWAILSPLLREEETPSSRLCVLAAQAEGALNNPSDASIWMQRAATAPREADWSDLDPSGESFDYTPEDWRRLVFSFGDTGELIHPRAESQSLRRLPGVPESLVANNSNTNKAVPPSTQPDDPGEGGAVGTDLADRFDSLLGRPDAQKKSKTSKGAKGSKKTKNK